MRIGLLEDDIAIQEMLLLVLQDEGYSVVTFADADECLQALGVEPEQNTPLPVDLLIVDWRLIGSISGTEVIQRIRQVPRLASLPVILTTAAAFPDTDQLRNLHVTLLEKPFALDEITSLVKNMTRSHS